MRTTRYVWAMVVLTCWGCAPDGGSATERDEGTSDGGTIGCLPESRACSGTDVVVKCDAEGVEYAFFFRCDEGETCLDGACVTPGVQCGNGVVDPGETCDPGLISSVPCEIASARFAPGGAAFCSERCQIDVSACADAPEVAEIPAVECPTEGQTPFGDETAETIDDCADPDTLATFQPEDDVVLRVYFHVARNADGAPIADAQDLQRLADVANRYWEPGLVRFAFANIDNPFTLPSEHLQIDDEEEFYDIVETDNQPDGLDVYIVRSYPGACGRAAGIGLSNKGDGVAQRLGCGGQTLAHELGHILGLWHTHRAFDIDEGDCHDEGDHCCDTPPDPGVESEHYDKPYFCDNPATPACALPDCYDADGEVVAGISPDVYNRMSYYSCSRQVEAGRLSLEQFMRARCHIDGQYGYALIDEPEPVECEGPAEASCGNCGIRTRNCEGGQWSAWSPCMSEGLCAPGQTMACGAGGMRTCSAGCEWGQCQICDGAAVQVCGDCGTRTRDCVDGAWQPWSPCAAEGECTPGAMAGCGQGGQQACSAQCEWGECTGQTCDGPSETTCGWCGEQSRTCNNGQWSAWSGCVGEGACMAGSREEEVCQQDVHPACRGERSRRCSADCDWGRWTDCEVAGRYRSFPENAACGPEIPESGGQRLCVRAWHRGDELLATIEKSDRSPFSGNEVMIQITDDSTGRVVADLAFCESFEGEREITLRLDEGDLTFNDGLATVRGTLWSPCVGGQRIDTGRAQLIRCE